MKNLKFLFINKLLSEINLFLLKLFFSCKKINQKIYINILSFFFLLIQILFFYFILKML